MIWIHRCTGLRHALKAQSLGADIVTVVGHEMGGATGRYDLGTLVVVPTVAKGSRFRSSVVVVLSMAVDWWPFSPWGLRR